MDAAKTVTLYYFPGSYYSLKVLLALYEKDVTFDEHLIFILFGEQNKDWFLKKNAKGEVPVLEIDGTCYSESENIIDVIDEKFKAGPRLIPALDYDEVQAFRKLLHNIPIDVITYGVFANQHLSVERYKLEKLPSRVVSREAINKRFSGEVTALIRLAETCPPDMKAAVNKKIAKVSRKLANVLDEEVVCERLNELEDIFDKIAERLEKTKQEQGSVKDVWLFGPNFNAADITAVGLMIRLAYIGIASRYFSNDRRKIVHEYYTKALQRKAVKKIIDINDQIHGKIRAKVMRKYGVKALKAAVFVGLITAGFIGVKELFKTK